MRVLVSAIHYPVSAARFLAEGFRRLGHEVVTIGPTTGGQIPWGAGADFSQYAWTPDILLEPDPPHTPFPMKTVVTEQAVLTGVHPDLVVQCDANLFLDLQFDCPNVVWAVDNHVAKYDEVKFDLFFGAHSWGFGHTRDNFRWLPCAYDPQVHYEIEGAVKEFDACLIAVMYPQRIELLNALAQHGLIYAGTALLGKEYNAAYNAARIALVQSACGDVPMRLFENAAQGLTILCDRQPDLPALGLTPFEHYVPYNSIEHAAYLFRELVNDPAAAQEIAKAGQKALAPHTYEARALTILNEVNNLKGVNREAEFGGWQKAQAA